MIGIKIIWKFKMLIEVGFDDYKKDQSPDKLFTTWISSCLGCSVYYSDSKTCYLTQVSFSYDGSSKKLYEFFEEIEKDFKKLNKLELSLFGICTHPKNKYWIRDSRNNRKFILESLKSKNFSKITQKFNDWYFMIQATFDLFNGELEIKS